MFTNIYFLLNHSIFRKIKLCYYEVCSKGK